MRDKLCLEEATSSVSSHHPDHFPNGPHVRLSHVSAPRGGIQPTDRRALETRGDAFVGERARVEIPDTDSVCVSVAVAGRRRQRAGRAEYGGPSETLQGIEEGVEQCAELW